MSDKPSKTPIDILLVEDNPGDVPLVVEAFREGGAAVRLTTARDGEEALAVLRRQGGHAAAARPALILLDLNLPRIGRARVAGGDQGGPRPSGPSPSSS